jgi:hypothetical protein
MYTEEDELSAIGCILPDGGKHEFKPHCSATGFFSLRSSLYAITLAPHRPIAMKNTLFFLQDVFLQNVVLHIF